MRFKINKESDCRQNNPLGCDFLDVLQFNYDGKGSAICFLNGIEQTEILSRYDIDFVMCHYTPELPAKHRIMLEKILN